MNRIVNAWAFVALVLRAALFVPLGLLLLLWAFAFLMAAQENVGWLLLSGWCAYHGGKFVVGSLAGFIGAARRSEPSARDALRRSGMLGRR